ncbi:jerky protein homolog-like [Rhagoletis pomonella]|uniref:jerky protein homolog-like n=1 Tax=Rhagoletis pomonella TaxID=28610 RepID=UPI00177F4004|nr:jerky protein homolog-like [Rhagoletis pomonella]
MLPKMALLLLNNAPSHPPADQLVKETEDGKIWVMYFPPNVTPLIQPMDQNAIRLLKLHYRTSLLSMVVTSVESLETCLKQTNLFQAVSLLALAWKKVSQESLKKCWNRIFNDDGFDEEDDVPLSILQQSEENLATRNSLRLLERVFPNVEFDVNDVTEWNNENIIDDILSFNDHDEEETIVAPAEMPKVNHVDAINCFQTCIEWAVENQIDSSKTLLLRSLQEEAMQVSLQINKRQSLMTEFLVD